MRLWRVYDRRRHGNHTIGGAIMKSALGKPMRVEAACGLCLCGASKCPHRGAVPHISIIHNMATSMEGGSPRPRVTALEEHNTN